MSVRISNKHMAVDKAKTITVGLIAAAAVVTVFSLVVARSFLSQARYLNKVNGKKETALKQLQANEKAVSSLVESYKAFAGQEANMLNGNKVGTGERDGDNAKLVLDALPSKYDFPGLVASVSKLISADGQLDPATTQITGVDNTLKRQQSSPNPKPDAIDFGFKVSASYDGVQGIISRFERSIRPFQFTKLELRGASTNLELNVSGKTYYQPAKDLQITKEDVK